MKNDYYKTYQRIIGNKELIKRLRDYGYKLCMKLHPEMERFKKLIRPIDGVEIWDAGYTEIFAESELLITDYSSIAFDFSQLYKPVIYYQFDEDTFWAGEHNYTKGYFDYRRDGFGEVVNTYEELERVLFSYVANNCNLKETYRGRIESFFAYQGK